MLLINQSLPFYIIALYLSAAFDLIDHKLLISWLETNSGIDELFLQ